MVIYRGYNVFCGTAVRRLRLSMLWRTCFWNSGTKNRAGGLDRFCPLRYNVSIGRGWLRVSGGQRHNLWFRERQQNGYFVAALALYSWQRTQQNGTRFVAFGGLNCAGKVCIAGYSVGALPIFGSAFFFGDVRKKRTRPNFLGRVPAEHGHVLRRGPRGGASGLATTV